MDVTVIIPTYNRSQYLAEAITSVLRQSVPASQIIIVDDGSDIPVENVMQALSPDVEYIYKPNGGKSSALNVGLRHARHDYVWIFDDDDVAEPHALERLTAALARHPECGFAYGEYKAFSVLPTGVAKFEPGDYPPQHSTNVFRSLLYKCSIFQSGMLVRKSCYDEVGPFDESFIRSQDYEMLLRITRRFRGVWVDSVLFHQRRHSGIRGTANLPIVDRNKYRVQRRFDQDIFSLVYKNVGLKEFLYAEAETSEPSDEDMFDALLERATIMGRKGLWEFAALDLKQALQIAKDTRKENLTARQYNILSRMFDESSIGIHDLARTDAFHSLIRHTGNLRLLRRMRKALSRPLFARIARSVRNGNYSDVALLLSAWMCVAPLRIPGVGLSGKAILKVGQIRP